MRPRCSIFSLTLLSRRSSSSAPARSSHAASRAGHLEDGRTGQTIPHHVSDFSRRRARPHRLPRRFSGFFSKDAILAIAYEQNPSIFSVGLFTAFLTAFYVTRLFVVVFLGKPRSDAARGGNEAPFVMTGPLVILTVLSALGGFAFFAGRFLALPQRVSDESPCPGARDHLRSSSGPAWAFSSIEAGRPSALTFHSYGDAFTSTNSTAG